MGAIISNDMTLEEKLAAIDAAEKSFVYQGGAR